MEISTTLNAIKQNYNKVDLETSILKHDVFHDALLVIFNTKLKLRRPSAILALLTIWALKGFLVKIVK